MKEDHYIKLKEDIQKSGLSVARYCKEHNLNRNTVYNALHRLEKKGLPLMVIKVPDANKQFEMKFDGIHIQIEYQDESSLSKAIEGLRYVFAS